MNIFDIIQELNDENGSNYKVNVLKKYKDHELLKTVLEMAYDHVKYNFGIGKTSLGKLSYASNDAVMDLSEALDILKNKFCTREVTGNAALEELQRVFNSLSVTDQFVLTKIIERDLRIGIGKTQINKAFKGLITKPIYMRCDLYNKKNANNIKFPAMLQLKADGTYREFNVDNGIVQCQSRSGEKYEYPNIFAELVDKPDGIYVGELTVYGVSDRSEGNGLINSSNPPHDLIKLELWDYIEHDEYVNAGLKDRKNPCTTPYSKRWDTLVSIINEDSKYVKLIPHYVVQSLSDALSRTSEWMQYGYEGSILKDFRGVFKDGTSKHQLKIKIEISAEMRCVGFQEGTKGTKREGKVGSILFANDEGTIKGKCSGFNDKELDYFTENQDKLIGKIMEVQFNDLSKASNHDYYALSHPRFIEFRDDKDETDDLSKVLKLRAMAIELSE